MKYTKWQLHFVRWLRSDSTKTCIIFQIKQLIIKHVTLRSTYTFSCSDHVDCNERKKSNVHLIDVSIIQREDMFLNNLFIWSLIINSYEIISESLFIDAH